MLVPDNTSRVGVLVLRRGLFNFGHSRVKWLWHSLAEGMRLPYPIIGSKMKLRREKLRGVYRFSIIMFFALALGLAFSATDFGSNIDGLFFDRIAPLLGTPMEVHDPLVILIGEDDYSAAGTPLALWGTHLVPLLERIELGTPEAIGFRCDPSSIPFEPNQQES